MCLALFSIGVLPGLPLLIAANRDEYRSRPTAPARFWDDAPDIMAGKDLKDGGTWLGITRGGRYSFVTTVRNPNAHEEGRPSRGKLVREFLMGHASPESFMKDVAARAGDYNPFNLVVGTLTSPIGPGMTAFLHSPKPAPRILAPGTYVVSNGDLDAPWPKAEVLRQGFLAFDAAARSDVAKLFPLLFDAKVHPPEKLPKTGVPAELEGVLSAAFIDTADYGTRSSTIVLARAGAKPGFYRLEVEEKRHEHKKPSAQGSSFSFMADAGKA